MTAFTKLIMLISLLVLMIGGGFSFYLAAQGGGAVAITSTDERGVALDGFDAVAYHTARAPQKGVEKFQVSWAGSLWYFTNLENRQSFSRNPEKYMPAFGGHDPYGMATGGIIQPATPELWEISKGRLYLFYSGKTRTLWHENKQNNLKKATLHWTRIKQQTLYKAALTRKSRMF